jgi:glycosyltransferase involved in cell wall biosynthesis
MAARKDDGSVEKVFDMHIIGFYEDSKKGTVDEWDGIKHYNAVRNDEECIKNFIETIRPDIIVYSHDCFLFDFMPKLKAAYPHILNAGYFTLDTKPVHEAWRSVLETCDIIFTPSIWAKDVFLNYNPGYTVEVVPYGISENFVPPTGKREEIKTLITQRTEKSPVRIDVDNKFICLYVGHNQTRKGVSAARDGWIEFAKGKNDARFIMIMHTVGDKKSPTHAMPLELFEHPSIMCFNIVFSDEDLVAFYHCADHLLYPTHGDGFALTCLEALATECTPIVTNWSSQTDFCNDNNSIMLTNNSYDRVLNYCYHAFPSAQEITEKLENLYQEWKLCKATGKEYLPELKANGLQVAQKYTWDNAAMAMQRGLFSAHEIKNANICCFSSI